MSLVLGPKQHPVVVVSGVAVVSGVIVMSGVAVVSGVIVVSGVAVISSVTEEKSSIVSPELALLASRMGRMARLT